MLGWCDIRCRDAIPLRGSVGASREFTSTLMLGSMLTVLKRTLRKLVPNVPLQALVRGANGVGYTSYP
jgi:hypothetical protein